MSEHQVKQFYRRELPAKCISFSSREGKKLFSESLSQGCMECYFKLAEQFRTQDEPAFCGLTTLVMVLNSLSMDPGRVWRAPWRWYHENMLDCCVPLQMIKEEGINFHQMICLACCNGLDVQAHQLMETDKTEEALANFRTLVKKLVQHDDKVLVLSYSRKILGQTGDGHFSPLGGYHPQSDLVLILDTARFKYPPHWVQLKLLWEAMHALDKSTGKSRGYMIMSRMDIPSSLVLFRLFPVFSVSLSSHRKGGFSTFLSLWRQWLSQSSSQGMTSKEVTSLCCAHETVPKKAKSCCSKEMALPILTESRELPNCKDVNLQVETLEYLKIDADVANEVQKCVIYLLEISENISVGDSILTTNVDLKCVKDESREHTCLLQVLLSDLESLSLFHTIRQILSTAYSESSDFGVKLNKLGFVADSLLSATAKICKGSGETDECNLAKRIGHSHFLTIFLLSWPYGAEENPVLKTLAESIIDKSKETVLHSECVTLRKQISLLMQLCNYESYSC